MGVRCALGRVRAVALLSSLLGLFSFSSLPLEALAQFITPSSFAAQSNGNFAGSIPIRVPPATGGLVPQLAISYSSHSPNGPLGIGFSLQGLSAVTRCARTVAQDGVLGNVNYDANDRFCLDGQRLIAINGAYGANGTEYRTELDSFTQIFSYGTTGVGPTYFTAKTKSGLTETFGNTSTSGVVALGGTSIRVWALSQVMDTASNFYTLSYTLDSTNGAYYPNTISYTGNGSVTPQNSIVFNYPTGRTDIMRSWTAGSMVGIADRLSTITVSAGSQVVRQYSLAYDNGGAAGASRLLSVTECAAGGTPCMPPVTVSWGGGATSSQSGAFNMAAAWTIPVPGSATCAPFSPSGTSLPPTVSVAGNFTGSARSDILCNLSSKQVMVLASNGSGSFNALSGAWPSTGTICANPLFGDFNGDGKEDLVCWNGSAQYTVSFSNGDGTFRTQSPWTAASSCNFAAPYVGDFDGDGRSDLICEIANGSHLTYQVEFSNGDGTFATPTAVWPSGGNFFCHQGSVQLADFNGDGKTDILCTLGGSYQVAFSNGDGTFTEGPTWSNGSSWCSAGTVQLGDFNGDGKTDMLCNSSGSQQSVAFSTGNGNFTVVAASAFLGNPVWCSGGTITVADFNGDGKADMMCSTSSFTHSIAFSNGDGSFTTPTTPTAAWCNPQTIFSVGDLNGDGESDLACMSASSVSVALSGGAPDLVSSVNNGVGATVAPNYSSLANAAVYTKDSGANSAVYPSMDLTGPFYVVSSISRANGIGGQLVTNYTYGGLKVDQSGRGSLGFRLVSSTDAQTSIVSSAVYQQVFPYIGLASSSQTSLAGSGSGGMLKTTANIYSCTDFVSSSGCTITIGRRYYVSPNQTTISAWDLDGAVLPTSTTTSTYDSYGNPTQVVNTTGDGYSTTTVNTYNNDTVHWWIGQLTESQVTATTP